MPEFFIPFFFVLGAIFGSFANVLILRIPAGKSIVPRSQCPHCHRPIAAYDNIPLFSWLILRGRCRGCGAAISSRYFFVELIMASLFMAAYITFGFQWFLLEMLIFIFAAVTASFIDIDHFILPDIFTLGGLVIALLGAALNPERSFWDAVFGVLAGGGLFYSVAYLYYMLRKQEGMGGGDIKLLAWIGALMGWQSIGFVVFVSCFAGAMYGIVRSLFKRGPLESPLQFGPFIVMAALFYAFGAQTIVQWYLEIIGLT